MARVFSASGLSVAHHLNRCLRVRAEDSKPQTSASCSSESWQRRTGHPWFPEPRVWLGERNKVMSNVSIVTDSLTQSF